MSATFILTRILDVFLVVVFSAIEASSVGGCCMAASLSDSLLLLIDRSSLGVGSHVPLTALHCLGFCCGESVFVLWLAHR